MTKSAFKNVNSLITNFNLLLCMNNLHFVYFQYFEMMQNGGIFSVTKKTKQRYKYRYFSDIFVLQNLSTTIVMDVGHSLNPALDIGQVSQSINEEVDQ